MKAGVHVRDEHRQHVLDAERHRDAERRQVVDVLELIGARDQALSCDGHGSSE
jgi:hypothetical protein